MKPIKWRGEDMQRRARIANLDRTPHRVQMTKARVPSARAFASKYGRMFSAAPAKHVRLRMMLDAALEDGVWKEGETIYTEHELAHACSLSVGTVQRAIRDLVIAGDLKRVPGRGTFVMRRRYRLGEPFTNTRFLDDDGIGILPVTAALISKRWIAAEGPWTKALRSPEGNVVRIERLFDVNREFLVLSRFHFDAERFARVAALGTARLKTANLKLLLTNAYKLRTITHHQNVRFIRFSKEVGKMINRGPGSLGLLQSITATVKASDPIYYHELFIPPCERALELPTSTF